MLDGSISATGAGNIVILENDEQDVFVLCSRYRERSIWFISGASVLVGKEGSLE